MSALCRRDVHPAHERGYLLWTRGGTLLAQSFDAVTLALSRAAGESSAPFRRLRSYTLSTARDAFRRFGAGHHLGKIVITVE